MNELEKPQNQTESKISQKQIERGHELGDWFIFRETRHFGPLNTKQINQFLLTKLISNQHHIWRPGFKEWMPIYSIESFRACGQSQIEFISDNDFSHQAQLGPIDRIKFQESDVSFQESSVKKVSPHNIHTEITDKIDDYKIKLIDVYNSLLESLGVDKDNRKFWNIGLVTCGSIISLAIIYVMFSTPKEEFFVKKLPKEMAHQLMQNVKQPENTKNPSLIFLEKDTNLKDPIFVGSVNLPLGSKIKIDIEGNPKTLIDSYRFSKSLQITLLSHYFQTEPIRGVSGEYIPSGHYNVSVRCLSCDKENYLLFESDYRFGVFDEELYSKKLKEFHQKTRNSANLELTELKELSETLMDQYQNSMSIYNRSINSKSLNGWNKFSAEWLSHQKKLVDLFQQIQSEDLKNKLYYLSLYEAYNDLTQLIFELHTLQDHHLLGMDSEMHEAEKISEVSQKIKLKSTYLTSQVDLMRVNFNQSKGLPSQDGLNLKNL